jgi:hypothetical protein
MTVDFGDMGVFIGEGVLVTAVVSIEQPVKKKATARPSAYGRRLFLLYIFSYLAAHLLNMPNGR